ncbi:unnamed protein product [Musa acuminata subsp. burmannicoides]
MGGGEDGRAGDEVRAPLLVAGGDRNGEAVASRVPRKNSVNSMRVEFVARLPEKVKKGVDPERPFDIDVSLTKDLIEGEKEYYEKQFVTLRSFEEIESLNVPSVVDEALELEEQEQSEFAMKISNYANLALLGLKIYATVQSGSIAIAASTLDSLLDLMAGGILWFTHLSMKNINVYQVPDWQIARATSWYRHICCCHGYSRISSFHSSPRTVD